MPSSPCEPGCSVPPPPLPMPLGDPGSGHAHLHTCVSMGTPLCLHPGLPWSGTAFGIFFLWVCVGGEGVMEGTAAPELEVWLSPSSPGPLGPCPLRRDGLPPCGIPLPSFFHIWEGRDQPPRQAPSASPSLACLSPWGAWQAQHFRRSWGKGSPPRSHISLCSRTGSGGHAAPDCSRLQGEGTEPAGGTCGSRDRQQTRQCTPATLGGPYPLPLRHGPEEQNCSHT